MTLEIAELQPTEAPGIDEAQLPPAGQAETCMGVRVNLRLRLGHQQTAAHAKVNDPLRFGLPAAISSSLAVRCAQLADDVFSGTVYRQNLSSSQTLGLTPGGSLERLGVSAEPGLHNAVPLHPFVDTAGNRLHLGQFRHSLYCMRITCGSRDPESGSPRN